MEFISSMLAKASNPTTSVTVHPFNKNELEAMRNITFGIISSYRTLFSI
ncbi:hypothetical protein [Bacillus mycoides]|nr:hypothetical protein [Bacillus mycoides]